MANHAEPAPLSYATPQVNRDRRDLLRQRVIEKILIVIFLATAIGFSFAPIRNQIRKMKQGQDGTKDYPLWYDTGYRERHNISPYYKDRNGEFPFMYPPGAAGLLAPLTVLGKMPLVIFLVLLNSVAWATCILAPIYLVSGKIRGHPPIIYWLPSLVSCVYIWDTYLEGQLAFCLSAALLGMFVCLKRNWEIRAGLLLAIAAGFKAFPILALPYLIYRRHWKALAATLIFLFLFLFVIPACYRGDRGAYADLRTWTAGMLSPNTPEKMGANSRGVRSYTWQNGSLLAVTHRWLRPVWADTDDGQPGKLRVNIGDMDFKTINHIATGLSLLLCAGYLLVMPRQRDRTRFTDAAEMAMLLILIILFSPVSFTYNNSWLMFGMVVVLYYISTQPREKALPAKIWLTLALLPLLLSVSTTVQPLRYLRALGNTCFADVMLLAELAWLILRQTREKSWNTASLSAAGLQPADREVREDRPNSQRSAG
jgi:hypothetical protein